MRDLTNKEVIEINGGNLLNDVTDYVQNGMSPQSQTLAVSSLSAGMVVGSMLPYGALIGVGVFAAWTLWDVSWDFLPWSNNDSSADATE